MLLPIPRVNNVILQTFIRNATGKALIDSPALNPHSRAVLIPLAAVRLPHSVISVPGPGPVESHATAATDNLVSVDKEPPPPPPSSGKPTQVETTGNTGDAGSEDGDGDDDAPPAIKSNSNDPYSNLDSAFGNYLADAPRPMGNTSDPQRQFEDDLLI